LLTWIPQASIARKLYLRQGIGLGTFKKIYGRRQRRGVLPIRFREGSGSIARWILKELERLKVVEKDKSGCVFFCWVSSSAYLIISRLSSAAGSLLRLVSVISIALLALLPASTPLWLLLSKGSCRVLVVFTAVPLARFPPTTHHHITAGSS
jgi:hypothetical protein